MSVEEQSTTTKSLSNISEIIVLDNGNVGNASDIEVNFKKQEDTDGVLKYRVFLTNANGLNTFEIKEAQASIAYGRGLPESIFW